MKNCNECHSINNSNAKYCRHCGAIFIRQLNILEQYPKMKLVPTNFYDWRKPKVGMFLKFILLIPIAIGFFVICFSIWSLFYYNQHGYEDNDSYETHIEDPLGGFMLWADGYGHAYKWNGSWYESYDSYDNIDSDGNVQWEYKYEGEIENPVSYTTENALRSYRNNIVFGGIWCIIITVLLFIMRNYIICGYPKRPKDVKQLCFYADYVQKYSYWGIFRKRETPKFVLFVKDNMFGILDVAHYKVYLSAQYDYLEWREKKKYLNATLNGRNFITDIHGNELK